MIDSSDRTSKRLLDSIRKAKAGEISADAATAGEIQPTPNTAEPTPPSAPRARRILANPAPVTPAATTPSVTSQSANRASSATRRTSSATSPRVGNAATTAQEPNEHSGRRQSVADPGATTEKKWTDRGSGRVWPD